MNETQGRLVVGMEEWGHNLECEDLKVYVCNVDKWLTFIQWFDE